jgi:hypothetical protein
MLLSGLTLMLTREAVFAQRTLADDYDVNHAITLKGTVRATAVLPGAVPVCIVMDVRNDGGTLEKWVIAGNTINVLRPAGWRFGTSGIVKIGDPITVSAYLPKSGSKAAETLAAAFQAAEQPGHHFEDNLKDGRLAHGLEVTLPDGKRLVFGDSQ